MSGAPTVTHREIDVGDGLVLHAALGGHGPPLVVLHGFTGSWETWSALRGALDSAHQVIAIDLPGHGRSGTPADTARLALPRFADDLVRVLDALDVERTALLGYSLGGRAALHVASVHAERLSALVLESASPGVADQDERSRRATSDAGLADAIERDGIESFVQRWESLPLWESQRALPGATRAGLRRQRLQSDPRGLAASLRGAGAGAEPVLSEEALAFDVPTLLVAGALDEKYVAIAQRLAAGIPGARCIVVEGAGHAVHLEQPAVFASLVRDFLRPR